MNEKLEEAYEQLKSALAIHGLQYYALEDTESTKNFIKQSAQNGGYSVVVWKSLKPRLFEPTKVLVVCTVPYDLGDISKDPKDVSKKIGRRLKALRKELEKSNFNKNIPVVFLGCSWISARDFAKENPDISTWFMGKSNSRQRIIMESCDEDSKQSLQVKSFNPPHFNIGELCTLNFVDEQGILNSTGQNKLYLPRFQDIDLSTGKYNKAVSNDAVQGFSGSSTAGTSAVATHSSNNVAGASAAMVTPIPVRPQPYDFGDFQQGYLPEGMPSPRPTSFNPYAPIQQPYTNAISSQGLGASMGAAAGYHGFLHPHASPIAIQSGAGSKRPRATSFDGNKEQLSLDELEEQYGKGYYSSSSPVRKGLSPRR